MVVQQEQQTAPRIGSHSGCQAALHAALNEQWPESLLAGMYDQSCIF